MMQTPMGGGGTLKSWPQERLGVRPMHQMATTVPQFTAMAEVDVTLTSALREHAEPVFRQQTGDRSALRPSSSRRRPRGCGPRPKSTA